MNDSLPLVFQKYDAYIIRYLSVCSMPPHLSLPNETTSFHALRIFIDMRKYRNFKWIKLFMNLCWFLESCYSPNARGFTSNELNEFYLAVNAHFICTASKKKQFDVTNDRSRSFIFLIDFTVAWGVELYFSPCQMVKGNQWNNRE